MVFLQGCGQITGKAVAVPQETTKSPEAYFCPETDCSKAFAEKINSANFSVHCGFYDINLKNIINSLARKSKTADVRLVIDSDNYDGQVKGEGVRMDDKKQLMHNKFCVIDKGIVLTGSFNPTDNDNNYNNNNILIVYSAWLAQNYEEEFEELWNGEFGSGRKVKNPVVQINGIQIENYFCPEDDCAAQIIHLIKNSKSSVKAAFFTFTSENIADELLKAQSRGINVKVLVESRQRNVINSQYKRLKDFGMGIELDNNKYTMHHKFIIIDDRIVATGSFNPTLSADTKNDENLLILHDEKIAGKFSGEFERIG
ncbi:hypothetical protein HY487_01375 [Candidatus Woesearchaeota archaeon]|nr:hypothetical protein [Candidatus Woesearchaeota archaeon]